MKRVPLTLIAACGLALTAAAWAQTGTTTITTTAAAAPPVSSADASYLKRSTLRFGAFAGSSDNLASLAGGLRGGTEISLTGNGETAVFTSPTRPMGYGNITRALDLAQRQLAAQGITEPTPSQIQAALMGGTVSGPNGDIRFAGVLQMRSQGMGWGQIAHGIGVHPGLGKAVAPAAATGITSATGRGAAVNGTARHAGNEHPRVSTAAGGSSAIRGSGRDPGAAAAVTTAAGASAAGLHSASGQGHAFGRAGK